jgi:hypothetical protein
MISVSGRSLRKWRLIWMSSVPCFTRPIFPTGFLGKKSPGEFPELIMEASMRSMMKRTDKPIRPWVQGFWYPAATNSRPNRWDRERIRQQLVHLESNRTLWCVIPSHGCSIRGNFVQTEVLSFSDGSFVGKGSINPGDKRSRQLHQL